MRKIILASGSPRRKELLESIGLKFSVEPSKYEEEMDKDLSPGELVKYLSEKKALDVAERYKSALVIGADTVITLEGEVLGKPKRGAEEAKETLRKLSGKSHFVFTGFTIIDTESGEKVSRAVKTEVFIAKLLESEIESYVKSKEPLDKAGSYAIQGLGAVLVERIEGSYSNVVGLPLYELSQELKKFKTKTF